MIQMTINLFLCYKFTLPVRNLHNIRHDSNLAVYKPSNSFCSYSDDYTLKFTNRRKIIPTNPQNVSFFDYFLRTRCDWTCRSTARLSPCLYHLERGQDICCCTDITQKWEHYSRVCCPKILLHRTH